LSDSAASALAVRQSTLDFFSPPSSTDLLHTNRVGSAYLASCLRRGNGHTLGQTVIRVEVIDRTRRYQLMFHKHRWRDWPPVQNIQADANKVLAIAFWKESNRPQKTSVWLAQLSSSFGGSIVPHDCAALAAARLLESAQCPERARIINGSHQLAPRPRRTQVFAHGFKARPQFAVAVKVRDPAFLRRDNWGDILVGLKLDDQVHFFADQEVCIVLRDLRAVAVIEGNQFNPLRNRGSLQADGNLPGKLIVGSLCGIPEAIQFLLPRPKARLIEVLPHLFHHAAFLERIEQPKHHRLRQATPRGNFSET